MILDRFKMTDKIAFITGSARGIGFETARCLAEAGAMVILSDLDHEEVSRAQNALAQEKLNVASMVLDVTNSTAVEGAVAEVTKKYGRTDILVNNAGIGFLNKAADITDEEWNKVLAVNTNAVFWCSRAFGRQMMTSGGGAIVNIGSMSGLIINRPQTAAHYMVSKAAVHQMTKALAVEWAPHNIRVNAVAPGYTATDQTKSFRESPELYRANLDMTPMKRFADPSEIAMAVLFLASDAASYCTGSIVSVDGGYTCW